MIAENYKIVPVMVEDNIDGTTDLVSINVRGFHKATFIFTFGVGVDTTFTFHSGVTSGARTTALPFYHARGAAAIAATNGDVLEAWGNVPADGTTDDVEIVCSTRMVVCEVDLQHVPTGHLYLTGRVAAASGIVHAVAVLESRYKSNRTPTAA
jgi:hypothetical protein